MRALLLFTVLLGAATTSLLPCPPKYFYMENRYAYLGSARLKTAHLELITWNEREGTRRKKMCYVNIAPRCIRPYTLMANDYLELIIEYGQQACDQDGAYLPIIRSQEENDMFTRIATSFIEPGGSPIRLVLGIICDPETDQTVWVDGTPITYTGPAGSDPVHYNCSDSQSTPIYDIVSNRWERLPNNFIYLFSSLCIIEEKAEPTEEVTEKPDNMCGDYQRMEDPFDEDTPCYKAFSEPLSWEQAQKKCASDFGSLIAINSAEENAYFWNTAFNYNFTGGMHIGAHQSPDDSSKWTWIDGEVPITSKTFSNFIRSFPIPGSGFCASMATESIAAVWVNVDCTDVMLPFICQRGDFSIVPSSCPNAAPKAGEEIFSPSYPNSDIACEYFLNVDTEKLVEIEIISLVSIKDTDHLEIFEGAAGTTVLANMTGTIHKPTTFKTSKSNVLRVNWKPNGAADGRGFKIRYTEVDKIVDVVTTTPLDNVDTTTNSATTHGLLCLIVAFLYSFVM